VPAGPQAASTHAIAVAAMDLAIARQSHLSIVVRAGEPPVLL